MRVREGFMVTALNVKHQLWFFLVVILVFCLIPLKAEGTKVREKLFSSKYLYQPLLLKFDAGKNQGRWSWQSGTLISAKDVKLKLSLLDLIPPTNLQ
jgi:hypothetical protein